MTKRIEKALEAALLDNGEMEYGLYEYELEEHIDYWKASMLKDNDDYLFVVTENNGDVSMLLFEKSGQMYINELAREKLQKIWIGHAYESNIKTLMPLFVKELKAGIIPVNGVKETETLVA